jgi:hypothetical protein
MARSAVNLAFLALVSTVVVGVPTMAQERHAGNSFRSYPDVSKMRVELPIKGVLKGFQTLEPSSKLSITAQKVSKPALPVKTLGSTTKPALKQPRNEKVEPGKVRWHKAIQTAMDASKQSGKPVLLFQMMGRLDDRFC